jgi:hypothetical protein
LIEIRSLPRVDVDRAAISRVLAAAVAATIPCRTEAVWITWQTIEGPFSRGDVVSSDATNPFGPIVHVYHHRTPEQVERIVDGIEAVLARELQIDRDQVFVTTQPVAIDDPTLTRVEADAS